MTHFRKNLKYIAASFANDMRALAKGLGTATVILLFALVIFGGALLMLQSLVQFLLH